MPETPTPGDKPLARTPMGKQQQRTLTHAEWVAEATVLFGADAMRWRFECPVCQHQAAVQDWRDAGAPEGAVAFSCLGRFRPAGPVRDAFEETGKGPCNYAGGGLFRLNPVTITGGPGGDHHVFEFAKPETQPHGK